MAELAAFKLDGTWNPGAIGPRAPRRTVPVSVRVPKDIYDELGRYAKLIGSHRSYLIVECLRRLLVAVRAKRRAKAARQRAKVRREPR
jgi:hypothetical protein